MVKSIIYEDQDIVVCEKKPGVPVQSDKSMDLDMVNGLKNYLFDKEGKVPYIGLVHRLDRPVGGVMVFAKTPQAAKELSKQVQDKTMGKTYLCVIDKDLSEEIGKEKQLLTDYIRKDGRINTSKIVSKNDPQGKVAKLYYQVIKVVDGRSLIEVELLTGRHHQIRLQMATHLAGIVGDTKYNANGTKGGRGVGVALYSNSLTFVHPKTKKVVSFTKKPKGLYWDAFVE